MLFSQIEFFFFFLLTLAVLRLLPNHRLQKLYLLVASYYFYAYWDWRFLGLILFSTAVDYVVGLSLARTEEERKRKILLLLSLVANLGLLGFLKYFNFFVGSLAPLLRTLGLHPGTLQIILPVGISFYTFQTLSYTIDVYRRRIPPCRDPFDFALFVAFFPQLVAGPIVRAAEFLPQLETPRQLSWLRLFEGFRQFVYGLFKKVFLADRLALFVDPFFANPGAFDCLTTWLGVIGYGIQIYCDFSGYSDMAIGIARTLGYDFSENFNHPYLATNIQDFWRRWHISLSTWLRDYLYIPLGGNRLGTVRTYINLLLTMLLGGLWHGAYWRFIVWGGIHGVALALTRLLAPYLDSARVPLFLRSLWQGLGWLVTMVIVAVAWVFFRAQEIPPPPADLYHVASGFQEAALILRQMFVPVGGISWLHPFAVFAVCWTVATHILAASPWRHWKELPPDRWYGPGILFLLLWLVIEFAPQGFQPFVYFQF